MDLVHTADNGNSEFRNFSRIFRFFSVRIAMFLRGIVFAFEVIFTVM